MSQVSFPEEPLKEVGEGLLDVDLPPSFGDCQQAKMRNAINTLHLLEVKVLGLSRVAGIVSAHRGHPLSILIADKLPNDLLENIATDVLVVARTFLALSLLADGQMRPSSLLGLLRDQEI